jgi:hypothetical protein
VITSLQRGSTGWPDFAESTLAIVKAAWVVVVVCVARAAADPQPPVDPAQTETGPETSSVAREQLPHGVTMRGDTLVSATSFVDKNGTNYVVFSSTQTTKQDERFGPSTSTWLYADDWVVPKKGPPRNLLPVRDMVVSCMMGDPSATFHEPAFSVTDLDHDGIAEVTFAYELANCRSDTRPATYKLMLLENGTRYVLRGRTRITQYNQVPFETALGGGDYVADPVEAKWPAAFLAHVKALWDETDNDYELSPSK